jgi:hypothetical protein
LIHFTSFTLVEIAAFIKATKIKNHGVKIHKVLPIDIWLVDMVFDAAQNISFGTKLSCASIEPED